MDDARVLSIQSHVVRGYVGNKCATFPLQTLGFDVDAINSVQFSNHTQYKVVKGQILNEKDLGDIIDGLDGNNLLKYTHLLTGYVGSPSFLAKIVSVVQHLKQSNPGLIYVCDPVMGDGGRMYVPDTLLPIYQNSLVPLADVLTPNQFEIELLTGVKATNLQEAWEAIDVLHEKGCETVVLSSTDLGGSDSLISLASSLKGSQKERVTITIPKLDANFTGTGDLFASLLLAWLHKSKGDLKTALENTMCTMQAVVRRTLKKAEALSGEGCMTSEHLELQLIQSKGDIENPLPTIRAKEISS